jgi:hypothetical protein
MAGHVARIQEGSTYRVFVVKSLGRHRRRWENNTKGVFEWDGGMDWIDMA